MEPLLRSLARAIRLHPWTLVLSVLGLTLLSSLPLRDYKPKPNSDDLLPSHAIQARELIHSRFKGGSQPQVLLLDSKRGNVLLRENLLELARLSRFLRTHRSTQAMFSGAESILGPHRVLELFLSQVNRAIRGQRLFSAQAKMESQEKLFGSIARLLREGQKKDFFKQLFQAGGRWQRAQADAREIRRVLEILTSPLAERRRRRNWLGRAFDRKSYLERLSSGKLRIQDLRQEQIFAIFRYALQAEPSLRFLFSSGLSLETKPLKARYAVVLLAKRRAAIDLRSEESDLRVIQALRTFKPSAQKITVFGGINKQMEKDQEQTSVLLLICILIICGVLFRAFRQLPDVLLPLLGVLVVNLWMFSAASMLGFGVSMLTIMAPILTISLGVDYAIQSLSRYREEIVAGASIETALEEALCSVGGALLLSTITTVAGFLTNLLSPIRAIGHFGGTVAVGIAASFVLQGLFVPTLRFLIDRRRQRRQRPLGYGEASPSEAASTPGLPGRILSACIGHPRQVVMGVLLLTVGFFALALGLRSSFDWRVMLSDDSELIQATRTLNRHFPQAFVRQVDVVVRGDLARVKALLALEAMIQNTADDAYTARTGRGEPRVSSILPLLRKAFDDPALRRKLQLKDRDDNGLPDTDQGVRRLMLHLLRSKARTHPRPRAPAVPPKAPSIGPTSRPATRSSQPSRGSRPTSQPMQAAPKASAPMRLLPPVEPSSLLSRDLKSTLVRVEVTGSFSGSRVLRAIYSAIQADLKPLEPAGLRASLGGEPVLNHLLNDTIVSDLMNSIGLTMLCCLVLLIFAMRSGLLGLINVLPVGLVIIWILGVMRILQYDLNILTALIMALCVGVGIDFSIHLTHRFLEERGAGHPLELALEKATTHLGQAMLFSTLTTALGFGVLVFTKQAAVRTFATLVFFVISFSFLLSMVLMPVMLAWYDRRQSREPQS